MSWNNFTKDIEKEESLQKGKSEGITNLDERLLAYRRMGESSSRLLKEKARLHDTINKTLALSSASDSDYETKTFRKLVQEL